MKNILYVILLLLIVSFFLNCPSMQTNDDYTPPVPKPLPPVEQPPVVIQSNPSVIEGWVDDNTFRVSISGSSLPGLTDKTQRKNSSKEAAISAAQKRAIEKFIGARITGLAGKPDIQATGLAIQKEFSETVKNGKVTKEDYDANDSCTISYDISEPGLKSKVIQKHP